MSVIEVRRQHSRINNNPPHGCQPRLVCHQITSETHVAFDHRREGSTSSTDTRRSDISERSVSTKKRKTENEPVLTPNRAPPGLLVVSHSGSHVSARASFFPNRSMVVSRRASIQSLLQGENKNRAKQSKTGGILVRVPALFEGCEGLVCKMGVFKGRALREGVGGLEED